MIRIISITAVTLLLLTATYAVARQSPMEILFNNADTDHNGLISQEEWQAAMQKRFESLDKDKDNAVSPAEFRQARETLRDRFRK